MMTLNQISGIARSLSFKHPTNRAIIIIVASVFPFVTLVRLVAGDTPLASIVWAFSAAVAIFFAWAISRELNPDSNASAFISVALMLPTLFYIAQPTLLVLFWLLVITRILNRITGRTIKPVDLAVAMILSVILSWQELWLYCLITGLVLFANSWMGKQHKKGIVLLVIILSLGVVSILLGDTPFKMIEISMYTIIISTLLTLLFMPVIFTRTKIKSLTDTTKEPISVSRMVLTRITAVVTAMLVAILQGNSGFYDLLPLWTSIGGIIIWNIYERITSRRKN